MKNTKTTIMRYLAILILSSATFSYCLDTEYITSELSSLRIPDGVNAQSMWHEICLPIYKRINFVYTHYEIPYAHKQKNLIDGFFLKRNHNDFIATPDDITLFAQLINNLVSTLLSPIQLHAVSLANSFARLYTTTIKNTPYVIGYSTTKKALVQLYLDSTVKKIYSLPLDYGSMLNNNYATGDHYMGDFWFTTKNNDNNYLVNYSINTKKPAATARSFGFGDVTATSNPVIQVRNGIPHILFSTSTGFFVATKGYDRPNFITTSASSLSTSSNAIRSLRIICNDTYNNCWAACTDNTDANGLYYIAVTYEPLQVIQPTTMTRINLPAENHGQKIQYLTTDTLGYPVIITYPYTYNTVQYPSYIYTLNYDGSVRNTYNLGNVTIAPLLAIDSNNNYWACINGTALVRIKTADNTTTTYNLLPQIQQIIINNTPLHSITPTALTIDENDNPWLAFTQDASLFTVVSSSNN